MARTVLIYNPVSGRAAERAREAAASALVRAGWSVEIAPTAGPGHATDLARQAVADGVDALTVNGGDGTIAEAVAGLLDSEVPLGIVPRGTGNQLARNLGIEPEPHRAVGLVAAGATRRIDVGEWRGEDTGAYFTVACGAGFDAEIMQATTPERKRAGGMLAYAAQTIALARKLVPSTFRITVDGDMVETEASTVLVANCARVVPPYRPLRVGVSLDDGRLDVVALRAAGLRESISVWAALARGREDPSRIRHMPGTEIRIASDPPVLAECDGDVMGATPFVCRVLPGALEVFAPRRD